MAISNPQAIPRKVSSRETREEHAGRIVARDAECAEEDFDAETPVYIPPPRTRTRRIHVRVRERRQWIPNLNFPEAGEWDC